MFPLWFPSLRSLFSFHISLSLTESLPDTSLGAMSISSNPLLAPFPSSPSSTSPLLPSPSPQTDIPSPNTSMNTSSSTSTPPNFPNTHTANASISSSLPRQRVHPLDLHEIRILIGQFLPHHKDLASCARVSKTWQVSFEGLLWAKISLLASRRGLPPDPRVVLCKKAAYVRDLTLRSIVSCEWIDGRLDGKEEGEEGKEEEEGGGWEEEDQKGYSNLCRLSLMYFDPESTIVHALAQTQVRPGHEAQSSLLSSRSALSVELLPERSYHSIWSGLAGLVKKNGMNLTELKLNYMGYTPSPQFWDAVGGCLRLKSLTVSHLEVYTAESKSFWRACSIVEVLELDKMAFIGPFSGKDIFIGGMKGGECRVKTLRMSYWMRGSQSSSQGRIEAKSMGPVDQQLLLLQQCHQLQELSWKVERDQDFPMSTFLQLCSPSSSGSICTPVAIQARPQWPLLESLELSKIHDAGHHYSTMPAADSQGGTTDPFGVQDHHLATFLATLSRPLKKLSLSRSGFSAQALKQLLRIRQPNSHPRHCMYPLPAIVSSHAATVQDLNFLGCPSFSSDMIQQVLESCPNLTAFRADSPLNGVHVLQGRPWTCTKMTLLHLKFMISFDDSTPTTDPQDQQVIQHRAIFKQLAQLTSMVYMAVGGDLDMRLQSGLESLEPLKHLRAVRLLGPYSLPCFHNPYQQHSLSMLKPSPFQAQKGSTPGLISSKRYQHRLGTEDVTWMLKHWRQLERISPYMNKVDDDLNDALQKLVLKNGVRTMDSF